jgi:hypothetical protein
MILWAGGLTALGACLAAAVLIIPGVQAARREESAAVRSAVTNYAELYRQPAGWIYKYCDIRAERLGGGEWRVTITRSSNREPGGYRMWSFFKVDRDGKSVYLGQREGKDE